MSTYIKSFLLGLSGVLATYVIQFFTSTDFGPVWTPILAAGIPVLVNTVLKSVQSHLGSAITTAMWQKLLPALLLCGLAGQAVAADNIRIVGPSSVPVPGYPCDLYVQGDLPEGTRIAWDHFPKRDDLPLLEAKEGGRIARMNTMSGMYKLIVSVAVPGQEPVLRYHDFFVPGDSYVPPTPPVPTPKPAPAPPPQPTPTPDPTPQPDPEPTFPVGEFGMAQATYDLVKFVNSSNRRSETLCLAGKVSQLASDIEDKKLTTPQAVVNAIGAAFNECLPTAWNDARTAFTDKVIKLYTSGQLPTMAQWKTLAEESLTGLNAAAK